MRRSLWIIAVGASLLFAGSSCKKKDDDKKSEQSATTPTKPGAAKDVKPPPVAIESGDDLAKRVQTCIGYGNAKDAAKMASCYTENSVLEYVDFLPPMKTTGRKAIEDGLKTYWNAFSNTGMEPTLILVKDKSEAVTIGLNYGTNTGDYYNMKATNKKFGALGGSRAKADAKGELVEEQYYLDQGAWAGQLMGMQIPHRALMEKTGKPAVVAVAKGDKKEADNLASVEIVYKQMNAYDADKTMDQYTEEIKFKHQGAHADVLGKDDVQDQLEEWFKMTTDVQIATEWMWAAGDYVVAGVHSEGTNNGPIPGGIPATNKKFDTRELHVYHLKDAKVDTQWIFGNSYAFAVQLGFAPAPGDMKPGSGAGKAPEAAPPAKAAPKKKAG